MRIPYIVIIRDNEIETIHQTSEENKDKDLMSYVSANTPGMDLTEEQLDSLSTRGTFKLDNLTISIVWININVLGL